MAGNSTRRGAVRKTSKKGPTVGSGGQRRKALEGKGPTPKASDRPYHAAAKRKKLAEKAAARKLWNIVPAPTPTSTSPSTTVASMWSTAPR